MGNGGKCEEVGREEERSGGEGDLEGTGMRGRVMT